MKKRKKNSTDRLLIIKGILFILLIVSFTAICYVLNSKLPAQNNDTQAALTTQIEISEIMSKNVSILADSKGKFPDWIEIVNRGDTAVNLNGWRLLTEDEPLAPFIFPKMTLKPGEYAVVLATGQNQPSTMHAAFKLSASGETVLLMDSADNQADHVSVPALGADESYSRLSDGSWEKTSYCTPGMENSPANTVVMTANVADAIRISEVIPYNASLVSGGCDLIELTNTSNKPVSLAGYALSDVPSKPNKYVLGDIVLQPGQYLLIYADGENVPFKLSADGEQLILSTPNGGIASFVEWETMDADHSISFAFDQWTQAVAPTPGYPNTPQGAALFDKAWTSENTTNLFINEVLASSAEDFEWVELYNASSAAINLAGFGLSDDPHSPRKWQFPQGAQIDAGEYLIVYLSSRDTVDKKGKYHTNFSLSCTEPETLSLCTPDGKIIDRAYMSEMYGDVSIGRKNDGGFAYLSVCTPGYANSAVLYDNRAQKPVFSVQGGIFGANETVHLKISSPDGASIYYTLDGSNPTEKSNVYTDPLTLSSNTVVRAIAIGHGFSPSYIETQSYLFGISHTVRVVSVVSDPEGLFSAETGIMASAEGATAENDYRGANFWQDWERAANVEIFETDGTTLISQGCGISLHGANSRKRNQKALCLVARMTYDHENRFHAQLFSDRDYTQYQSFVLRAGGQDGEMSRLRDAFVDQLAADADVYYQERELCVVYLNGQYHGQYEMREKANRFSISDYEGWEDSYWMSMVSDHSQVMRGSDESYAGLMEWIKDHEEATDEDIAHVETVVDLDNYLNWMCVMIYSGNQDIGIKRYCNRETDGRWKWVVFDMDYAFYNDTNSMRRWLDPAGAGAHNKADNRLFVYIMKNEKVKDRFLTRFGELVTGPWAAEYAVAEIEQLYNAMLPEMDLHFERWTMISKKEWQKYVQKLLEYASTRDAKIIGYTQETFNLTKDEMIRYFGEKWSSLGQ